MYVYPPTVAAIFAATGRIDHQPSQVKISAVTCMTHSAAHMIFPFKKLLLLPRQKERTVFST